LNTLNNLAQQALGQFNKVLQFSLKQFPNNPAQNRDQIITEIQNTYDKYFDAVSPCIAYSIRKGIDFTRLEQEAREA
jgi:glutathione peroxidase-family protein